MWSKCVFVCDGLCDFIWSVFVCLFGVWLVVRVSVLCMRDCVMLYVLLLCPFVCVCLNVFVRVV